MWIKNRQKIDWNRMAGETNILKPKILELIRKETEVEEGKEISSSGYKLDEPVFFNFPPRLIVDARLDFKKERTCKPYDLEKTMRKVAKEASLGNREVELLEIPFCPRNPSLERDNVYGPDPEKPLRISFVFSLRKGDFIIS